MARFALAILLLGVAACAILWEPEPAPVPLAAVISTRPRPRITLVPAISIVNGWPGRALKASARTRKVLFDPGNQLVAQAVGQRVTGNQQALAPAVRPALGHGRTGALAAKFHAPREGKSMEVEMWLEVIIGAPREGFAPSALVPEPAPGDVLISMRSSKRTGRWRRTRRAGVTADRREAGLLGG